jgi:hypothetical protein
MTENDELLNGLTNEEFETLHTEPEETAQPPPSQEFQTATPEENTADTDLQVLIDTILGVNTDDG